MGILSSTWNRIVKVVMMPDEVMGIERATVASRPDHVGVPANVHLGAANREVMLGRSK